MPYIKLKNQPLFYFEHKSHETTLPTVVLIHGAGGTHLDWPPQIRRVKAAHIIAPDLPGHGQTASEGCNSVGGYAAVVLELLDTLRMERAVLAGHSMGAAIALQMALDAPERVAGLILIGGSARMRVSPALLEDTLNNTEGVVQFIAKHGYSQNASEKIKEFGGKNLRAIPARVLHGDYLACDAFDVRNDLEHISAPTLIIGSREDQMVPAKFVESLAAGLPNAEVHWIERAGHMIPVEAPEEAAALMQDWLTRVYLIDHS
jgi:pimeloyl-ACP methyl ester carboxylesterase